MPSHSLRPKGGQKHCAYCDRVFTKEEHLKRHQRSHTGEKPFKCHKCGRSYARSDVLYRHLQTHPTSKDQEQPTRTLVRQHGEQIISRSTNGAVTSGRGIPRTTRTASPEQPRVSASNRERRSTLSSNGRNRDDPQQLLMSKALLPDSQQSSTTDSLVHTPSQRDPIDTDTGGRMQPASTSTWDTIVEDNLNEYAFDHEDAIPSVPVSFSYPTPRLDDTRTSVSNEFTSGHHRGNSTSILESPRQQVMSNREVRVAQDVGNCRDEGSTGHAQTSGLEAFELPWTLDLGKNTQQAHFRVEEDLNLFSFGLGEISPSGALDTSPHMLDCTNYDNPGLPFSTSRADDETTNSPPMAFSAPQMLRIRRLWSRQRPKPGIRLIRKLWKRVIHHEADGIFSAPQDSCPSSEQPAPNSSCQMSRWGMDEQCRNSLIQYCKELDDLVRHEESIEEEMGSTPRSASEQSFSVSEATFPAMEILDSSLGFFFQFFHPILPFMHKSTFDAKNTPSLLLLSMCLVGLSYMDRTGTRAFVLRYLKRLMRSCRTDMTTQALTHCAPWELLTTLASTLIVVYLALGFRDEIDECQSYMLCSQMLHIAEKHGLFAASHGGDIALQLCEGPSDPEGSWKAWARVESTKRLIICFLWLDMAYTRLLSTAGVVEIDKVEVHLPCEDCLFESAGSAGFLNIVQRGSQLAMPRMNFRNFQAAAPSTLNDNSAQTLLRALYLKLAAARTRLSDETSQVSESDSFSSAEALATDSRVKDIITMILLLPTAYSSLVNGRNRSHALGWNYLCITLTADIDLLETASGRDGLGAASVAQLQVVEWSRSASARRAVLHAAQIFDILDSSRVRESHITRPDLLLFVSALVLSQYVFVSCQEEAGLDDEPTFELLQNIDWAVVEDEGLVNATNTSQSGTTMDVDRGMAGSNAARSFIRCGGPISFAGELQNRGGVAARKILMIFAHLMDGFGKWDGSRYSQLIRIMCDFAIEDGRGR